MVVAVPKGEKKPQHVAASRKRRLTEEPGEDQSDGRRSLHAQHNGHASNRGGANAAGERRVWGDVYKSRQNFVDMHCC
ncbi:hypothetical protein BaRGS_00007932 [Batillaria attramentaria]|uniref:Uncharacterized protein n=1 Tax=Batillaria attramentaria TaxID=370345 RepID=A0ABD0LNW6_9CAEN